MTNDDTGLGDLGARRVLAATAASIIPVLISKNESGEVFINSTDSDTKQWLEQWPCSTRSRTGRRTA
jgi:hypothetical protein